jgi:hypothetical protein
MPLKLIKTEMGPLTKERLYRMMLDVKAVQKLTLPEQRAAHEYLEVIRDEISRLLDRMDGK